MKPYETDSKLVSFFYALLRDELPAGVVEGLVRDAETGEKVTFTNGYIAKYAVELAERLSNAAHVYDVIVRGQKLRITASKFGINAVELLNLALEIYGVRDYERDQEWEMRDATGHSMIADGNPAGSLDTFRLPFYVDPRPGVGG